jgi:hypothetical protein
VLQIIYPWKALVCSFLPGQKNPDLVRLIMDISCILDRAKLFQYTTMLLIIRVIERAIYPYYPISELCGRVLVQVLAWFEERIPYQVDRFFILTR